MDSLPHREESQPGKRLSIPLNGFVDGFAMRWTRTSYVFFQFHWMDSISSPRWGCSTRCTFNSIEWILFFVQDLPPWDIFFDLSIPLNGFMGVWDPEIELTFTFNFQFHWMDSCCIRRWQSRWPRIPFNSIEWIPRRLWGLEGRWRALCFQFHWMDSLRQDDWYSSRLYIFQFHWMDSRWETLRVRHYR